VFRRHAATLNDAADRQSQRRVAIDGKTLRRSFDNFLDRRAAPLDTNQTTDKKRRSIWTMYQDATEKQWRQSPDVRADRRTGR
jgi:hypothetical protein